MASASSSRQLSGKTVIVTGANRGIGLELTQQLLGKGNTVIAASRDPDSAKSLQSLAAAGAKISLTQLDVTDIESIKRWAQALQSTVKHVDCVINNAGVMDGRGSILDVSPEDMLFCFKANTMGPLFVTQQLLLANLIGKPSGGTTLVANMTSKMGSVDDNGFGGSYSYRASKAALNIVNKSLSIDLEDKGITAVLLHPGYVKTDMTGGNGLITTQQCVEGLLSVLESDRPLNGRWYDFAGKEIPW